MFGNLVNARDVLSLVRRLTPWGMLRTVSRLARGRRGMVEAAWDRTTSPLQSWWDIPAVRRRWNRMISGDPSIDYQQYIARKYLGGGPPGEAISICCGTGRREIHWAQLGAFRRIDAYDISAARIEHAAARAAERGVEGVVDFRVSDVLDLDVRDGGYDAVLAESALHHLSPLEDVLERLARFLRPGGLLVVDDFVGPSRFQWTREQSAEADRLLAGMPEQYRALWGTGAPKTRCERPSRLRMHLTDPSEAAESSRIMPLLQRRFEIVEDKGYGGNVLHLLFAGIAQNFLGDDAETRELLGVCFDAEDAFLAREGVRHDFVVAVCRKRTGA
ncbi:MAG: class I SAM-dependent methyltransferase [Planctomycetota bacterium]|jgi:ubiquinone/menaquinone biosynthesis C-methylase UbiE